MKKIICFWIVTLLGLLPTSKGEEVYQKTLPSGGNLSVKLKIDMVETASIIFPDANNRSIFKKIPTGKKPQYHYDITFESNTLTTTLFSYETVMAHHFTSERSIFKIFGADQIEKTVYIPFVKEGDSLVLRFNVGPDGADTSSVQIANLGRQEFDAHPPSFRVEEGKAYLFQAPPTWSPSSPFSNIPLSTMKWINPSTSSTEG